MSEVTLNPKIGGGYWRSFNKLTPAEVERLAIISEECGEVVKIVGKILRHGYESTNPTKKKSQTNRELLEQELGDVRFATSLLEQAKDVDPKMVENSARRKKSKVQKYLHHNDTRFTGA